MPVPRIKNIVGVVIPTAWDAEGRVTAVGISATDEIEYLLAESPRSSELLGLVRREVEVTGVVSEHEGGRKRLYLEDYKLIRRNDSNEIV